MGNFSLQLVRCADCKHYRGEHWLGDNPTCEECGCSGFIESTKVEQSPSYSKSAQSEPELQYEVRPASSHYQCKGQHARIVVDQLVHMENTLKSNPPVMLEPAMVQLFQLLLALCLCGEAECRAFHKLVAQGLSSLLPALRNYLRTHKELPSSDGQ